MQTLAHTVDIPEHLVSAKKLSLQLALPENTEASTQQRIEEQLKGQTLACFKKLVIGSEFASRYLCEHPEFFADALADQFFENNLTREAISQQWQKLDSLDKDYDAKLRILRNRCMSQIIWRDFNRQSQTLETTAALTHLAEWCIQSTLDHHYQILCEEIGTPKNSKGEDQGMLVIGMGKLGAWELNLSSDVDLIFAYPDGGETQGARRSFSNQEFFTRLGQRIIQSLDKVSQDGFVFRVDMRLRPYGQSGALVSSFNALEDYYQTQGREWERFAMIKARVVAHNSVRKACEQLNDILQSFTYRKYVDFTAIDALRNLKELINREVKRRKLGDNVKLGRGGIREVEFIAQAFQIIRGGREIELQDRRVVTILQLLGQLQYMPDTIPQQLIESYFFLRDLEHGIQGFADQQTQSLPVDESQRERLAHIMNFDNWAALDSKLKEHRSLVHSQFSAVIAAPEDQGGEQQANSSDQLSQWQDLWDSLCDEDDKCQSELEQAGFDDPALAAREIHSLLHAPAVVAMHAMGRERLDALMPSLLKVLAENTHPSQTLQRVCPLLVAIARRSAYLLLLIENPGALKQLVVLTSSSPWIATRLAEQPALLDELLNPATLYSIPSKADLEHELRRTALRIPIDDLETQMEALRYFRSAHALQAAACEITGELPLMKVSDYLTELAEVIVSYVLELAWHQMLARHGLPGGETDSAKPNFIIVAYGKMGGIELAHGSDLDLVFIHDSDPHASTAGDAEGKRSIDNATFYMRLGQKIIHILNTQTLAGQLYEVDMRLRPSGNSGLLVASFNAFEKYQFESAWTWEHQALVRARAISGNLNLIERFDDLRQRVLCLPREEEKLRQDVIDMRQKMRSQLGSSQQDRDKGLFHLKQDSGGIVDIEFMVQYAVLAWAKQYPALTRYTDNIRILGELLDSGQLDAQEVHLLIEAYKAFRSIGHRLALQQQPGVVNGETVEQERQAVTQIWQKLFHTQS